MSFSFLSTITSRLSFTLTVSSLSSLSIGDGIWSFSQICRSSSSSSTVRSKSVHAIIVGMKYSSSGSIIAKIFQVFTTNYMRNAADWHTWNVFTLLDSNRNRVCLTCVTALWHLWINLSHLIEWSVLQNCSPNCKFWKLI